MSEFKVLFPGGSISANAKIVRLATGRSPSEKIVICDSTPFHPRDHRWPDQPADRGRIEHSGAKIDVIDCVTVAIDAESQGVQIDKDITVSRGDEGELLAVGHVVRNQDADKLEVGQDISLYVDEEYRRALNTAHTSVHLAALALNKAVGQFWTKIVDVDSLGNPNFDQMAIQKSTVGEYESFDTYRVGKSLRKKGFGFQEFKENVQSVTKSINETLSDWLAHPLTFEVTPPITSLGDRRTWKSHLPDGLAEIPCGGTHLKDSTALKSITIQIGEINQENEFTVHTTASTK